MRQILKSIATAAVLLLAFSCGKEKINNNESPKVSVIQILEPDGIHCTCATLTAKLNRIPDTFSGTDWAIDFVLSTDPDFKEGRIVRKRIAGSPAVNKDHSAQATTLFAETKYYYKAVLVLAEDWMIDSSTGSFTTEPAPLNNDHPYMDLGLRVKWAYCNQGADSPTKKGSSFNCSSSTWTPPMDYGGNWRLPTATEILELVDNCTKTFTRDFDQAEGGIWFTGPSGESIYLQCLNYTGETGDDGFFSSERYYSNFYYGLYLHSTDQDTFTATKGSYVKYGHVRAVFK